jgi:glycosidase
MNGPRTAASRTAASQTALGETGQTARPAAWKLHISRARRAPSAGGDHRFLLSDFLGPGMTLARNIPASLMPLLQATYARRSSAVFEQIRALQERYAARLGDRCVRPWSSRDAVLISYGDQIREDAATQSPRTALGCLADFLENERLQEAFSTVHLLPFFPYSSDDGFSVIDYRAVAPEIGDWPDVARLAERFALAFDLVLNHISAKSRWFRAYRRQESPYDGYFIEVDPSTDLSQVTRPRSLPLLTEVDTMAGRRHVWTTFSADQIDLNFANPRVLLEILDLLLFYVERGARCLRLDAVAFLWKQIGTSCLHRPQTHAVVKLIRALLDTLAPDVWLLTETNVPHAENISYFGDGDEAQLVYQFSLPPLLLDAFLQRNAEPLQAWLRQWTPPPPGCTFLNFTASHDGIGVRPLEGLVSQQRLSSLVREVAARGGRVSTRRMPDGRDAPYELNITWFDALSEPQPLAPDLHRRRFLASQQVMLGCRGIPAVYFHSLVATPNDHSGVETSGQARRINRRKFAWSDLQQRLSDPRDAARAVLDAYRDMLRQRAAQPAFHPDAPQQAYGDLPPWLIAFRRTALDGKQSILVLANVSEHEQRVDLSRMVSTPGLRNLLSREEVSHPQTYRLSAFEAVWLETSC